MFQSTKAKSNDVFISWIIIGNKRAIFHESWITLDNAKTYCTGFFVTRFITLSNNHKLKPVYKLDLQSTHKQKHNIAKRNKSVRVFAQIHP